MHWKPHPVSLFVRLRTKEGESQQFPSRTNPSILLKIPQKVTRGGWEVGENCSQEEPAEVVSFSTRPETREVLCKAKELSVNFVHWFFF
jgi:hypothetical protein